MEPNFQTWLDATDKLEEWMKQMIHHAYEFYQEELETAKEQLAEYYGN